MILVQSSHFLSLITFSPVDRKHYFFSTIYRFSGTDVRQSLLNLALIVCFYFSRCTDLECIHAQLQSSKVARMVTLLEAVESSYSPAMSSMQQDVRAGSGARESFLTFCLLGNPALTHPHFQLWKRRGTSAST